MSEDRDNELQAGVAELSSRLARVKLQIVKHRRPWHNRMAAYFAIGTLDHTTDVALSDEFIRDLPRTPEYQAAVDSYAAAVAGRVRCGSPNVFYCLSNVAIRVEINWPSDSFVLDGAFSAWLRVDVLNGADAAVAGCPILRALCEGWDSTNADIIGS
jgi:hypothetical protein